MTDHDRGTVLCQCDTCKESRTINECCTCVYFIPRPEWRKANHGECIHPLPISVKRGEETQMMHEDSPHCPMHKKLEAK